jgi:hypothetical protein
MFALLGQVATSAAPKGEKGALLSAIWPSLGVGDSLERAVALLGPSDSHWDRVEQIPACQDPCAKPCDTFYTCVREHSWYSSLALGESQVFSICTDTQGIVRTKSQGSGLRIDVSSGSYVDGVGEILGFGLAAFVLALPFAAGLRLWYRLVPATVRSVE